VMLLNICGALCFLVGLFITIPVTYLALLIAAEQLEVGVPAVAGPSGALPIEPSLE